MFKCPRCAYILKKTDPLCPECGFSLNIISDNYINSDLVLSKVYDNIDYLGKEQKNKIEKEIDKFEEKFPQFVFSVIFVQLRNFTNLNEFCFWILNRSLFKRNNIDYRGSNAIVFCVDFASSSANISVGYYVENFLNNDDINKILKSSFKLMKQGNFTSAVNKSITKISSKLQTTSDTYIKKGIYYSNILPTPENNNAPLNKKRKINNRATRSSEKKVESNNNIISSYTKTKDL